jgi:hypothetical protein
MKLESSAPFLSEFWVGYGFICQAQKDQVYNSVGAIIQRLGFTHQEHQNIQRVGGKVEKCHIYIQIEWQEKDSSIMCIIIKMKGKSKKTSFTSILRRMCDKIGIWFKNRNRSWILGKKSNTFKFPNPIESKLNKTSSGNSPIQARIEIQD